MASFRAWRANIGLLVGTVVVLFVLLETGLQLAGLFVGHRPVDFGHTGDMTLLTLGDSHTYGVYYQPEQSYPGQLQRKLTAGQVSARVINRGLPGMNSAQIARSLPGLIDTYKPTAVVLCVGINNVWNSADEDRSIVATATAQSKVLRLLRLLGRAIDDGSPSSSNIYLRPQIERELVDGGSGGVRHQDATSGEVLAVHKGSVHQRSRAVDDAAARLAIDLADIYQTTNRFGVRLVLLTYSAFPLPDRPPAYILHESMNAEMRLFSSSRPDVDLIDLEQIFLAELAADDFQRSKLFHTATEGHPNPKGYDLIASAVAEHLLSLWSDS